MQCTFKTPVLVPLLLLGLAVGESAHAEISGRARVDDLGYRLVDLRPNDGIAPAIHFLQGDSAISVGTFQEARPFDIQTGEVRYDGYTNFKPMGTVTAGTPEVSALARMSGTLGPGPGFDIVARGLLRNEASTREVRYFTAGAAPTASRHGEFEVTPFTRVIFSGFVAVEINRTVRNSATFLQAAQATVSVEYTSSPDLAESREFHLEFLDDVSMRQRYARQHSFVYENRRGEWGDGFFNISAGTRGELFRIPTLGAAPVSPVPEPASTALMLCGLGVVAGVAGRARRR